MQSPASGHCSKYKMAASDTALQVCARDTSIQDGGGRCRPGAETLGLALRGSGVSAVSTGPAGTPTGPPLPGTTITPPLWRAL